MAANKKVKFEITSEDKTAAGIKSALSNLSSMQKQVKAFGDMFKSAFAVGALSVAMDKVVGLGEKVIELYGEQEAAEIGLQRAIENNPYISGDAFNRLTEYASELQRVTTLGDEKIIQMMTSLGASGRTEDQIRNIISLAADMAAATGKSFESMVTNVNKTFGGLTGELGELIPELKDLSETQLRAGDAIDLLKQKYDGFAEAQRGTVQGSILGTKNLIGDLGEAVGASLKPKFLEISNVLDGWIIKLTDAINRANHFRDITTGRVQPTTAEDFQTKISYLEGELRNLLSGLESMKRAYQDYPSEELAKAIEENQASVRMVRAMLEGVTREYKAFQTNPSAVQGQGVHTVGAPPPKPTISAGDALAYTLMQLTPTMQALADSLTFATTGSMGGKSTASFANPAEFLADSMMFGSGESELGIRLELLGNRIDELNSAFSAGLKDLWSGSEAGSISGAADPMAALMGSLGTSFASMLGEIQGVNAILNPVTTILTSMFEILEPVINDILSPIVGILGTLGTILASALLPILEGLSPVIEAVAEVFVWLYNNIILPVGNLLLKVIVFVANGLIDFVNLFKTKAKQLAHISYTTTQLSEIDLADMTAAGEDYISTASGDSGTSATYSTPSPIYITNNIGTLVGEDGIREFTLIIRDELIDLGVLGLN